MNQSQFYLNQNSDLIPLKHQLKYILDEICWRVKISYGNELRLDIGEKIPLTMYN